MHGGRIMVLIGFISATMITTHTIRSTTSTMASTTTVNITTITVMFITIVGTTIKLIVPSYRPYHSH